MMAIDGSGAGASCNRGALPLQAPKTSVEIRPKGPAERDTFIPALLTRRATRRDGLGGKRPPEPASRCGERVRLAVMFGSLCTVTRNTTKPSLTHSAWPGGMG